MSKKLILAASVFLVAALFVPTLTTARTAINTIKGDDGGTLGAGAPAHCLTAHRIGRIVLGVSNNGTIGNNYASGSSSDCFTGQAVPSCEFPKSSGIEYLYGGAFWIGAVVGRDTLVSVGADGWSVFGSEMLPDESPFGDMKKRSIIDPSNLELYTGAVSEEDYIATYSDTYTTGIPPDWSGRPHKPLNIQVTQASYAWSYSYAEDIILFDYKIRNIGNKKIENAYMGLYIDGDVCFDCTNTNGFADDLCGFVRSLPAFCSNCEYEDEVNIAWIADNDGDPFSNGPTPNVTATRIVRTPAEQLDVSFNWWIGNGNASLDFGPRERANVGRLKEDFRDFGTGGLGTPEGDHNKYYVLRNQEFDYDQAFTAIIQPTDTLWLPPGSDAAQFAKGYDTRYLLSFGPFDINEGEVLPLSFAYFAGENFHHVIGNADNLPNEPQAYYDNLSFDSLGMNSRWASWMYDNPGVDTDGDGDFGELFICVLESTLVDSTMSIDDVTGETTWVPIFDPTLADSCYIKGDGVPDFRGASPPPAPASWRSEKGVSALRVLPDEGKLTVVWNGLRSETAKDAFSGISDFEGYRVYVSTFDSLRDSYSLMASYDVEDYNKWVWNPNKSGGAGYELLDVPFSIQDLRTLYGNGDPEWNPLDFSSPSSPYFHPIYADSQFYFVPQDYNVSDLGGTNTLNLNDNTPIELVYPGQAFPSTLDPNDADSSEVTDEGFFKYYEYKLVLDDLSPTVDYLITVTAFDFGSPSSGLPSLESPVDYNPVRAFAENNAVTVMKDKLKAFVYPNPYRIDGKYAQKGYEDAPGSSSAERQRRINFANLPERCTIRIFSLDGDMIREWEHNVPASDPTSGHDYWDLITRNTQQVVSGLYYWTVEDPNGNVQIGKLVIIL